MKRQSARGRAVREPVSKPAAVKDMILEALEGAGGVAYLQEQAKENPRAFLSLLTKVIPLQVTDKSDEPVVQVVRWANSVEEATPDPARQ